MSGAELRSWREKLGKDEAWAMRWSLEHARAHDFYVSRHGDDDDCIEHGRWDDSMPGSPAKNMRTAYIAALEAEERAQAERGPVEPVCPEGVEERGVFGGIWLAVRGRDAAFFVLDSGDVRSEGGRPISPALLEYAAALSRYRAAIHAASDKRRKLDAVRAADDAWDAARKAHSETSKRVNDAHEALVAARREAGL